jgi:hypothetical protein
VLTFSRRCSAVLLVLVLGADARAMCSGWASTPEARMDCCADERTCPMHSSPGDPSGTARTVTQADADRCCAASAPEDAVPSPASFVSPPALAVLPNPVVIALPGPIVLPGAWRTPPLSLVPHVPRHLLLSVLLV